MSPKYDSFAEPSASVSVLPLIAWKSDSPVEVERVREGFQSLSGCSVFRELFEGLFGHAGENSPVNARRVRDLGAAWPGTFIPSSRSGRRSGEPLHLLSENRKGAANVSH